MKIQETEIIDLSKLSKPCISKSKNVRMINLYENIEQYIFLDRGIVYYM